MKRQKLAFLVLVAATVLLLALIWWGPVVRAVVRGVLVSQLSSRLQAAVSLRAVEVSLLPPRIDMEGVEIKRHRGPLRYIGIGHARLIPGLGPIFLGRIAIHRIEIGNPTLRFDLTDRAAAAPKLPRKPVRLPSLKQLLRVDVREAVVHGARLSLKLPGEDVRVVVDAGSTTFRSDFATSRWTWDASGQLWRGAKSLQLDRVTIVADRAGSLIRLEKLEAEGPGVSVSMNGDAYPNADLSLRVRGELEPAERALRELGVLEKPLRARGEVRAQGRVRGKWPDVKWAGEFRGSDIEISRRRIPAVAFSFRLTPDELERASGEINMGGGITTFSAASVSKLRPGRFDLRVERLSLGALFDILDPGNRPEITGEVNLQAAGEIGVAPLLLRGEYTLASPELTLDLPPELRPYLPLGFRGVEARGEYRWTDTDGLRLENGVLTSEGLEVRHDFRVRKGPQAEGSWKAVVSDLAGIFPRRDVVTGSATVGGGLTVARNQVRAVLDLRIPVLRLKRLEPASFAGQIVFEREKTSLREFRMKRGDGLATLEAEFPTRRSKNRFLSLRGALEEFDLEFVAEAARRRYPFVREVRGRGSAQLVLSGTEGSANGVLTFEAQSAQWRGESYPEARAAIEFAGSSAVFQKALLRGEESEISVSGRAGGGSVGQLRVRAKNVSLGLFSPPGWVSGWVSHLDGAVTLDGDAGDPGIEGEFKLERRAGKGLFAEAGTARVSGPLSRARWNVVLGAGELQAEGTADLRDRTWFEGSATLRKLSLSNLFPRFASGLSGAATVRGNPKLRRSWEGRATISDFFAGRGDFELRLDSPGELRLEAGDLTLEPIRLRGPSTDLRAEGELGGEGALDLKLRGGAALQVATLLMRDVTRAEGGLDIEARVQGTLRDPRLRGGVEMQEGVLQFRNWPHPFESVALHASLEQQRVFVDRLEARSADGTLSGAGHILLPAENAPGSFDLEARVDRMHLRFPDWLPSTLSGTLSLTGPLAKPTLRGDLAAHEATYRDDWDWQAQILKVRAGGRAERLFRSAEEHVRFDILIRSEGDRLFLRNNMANAVMRGEVRLVGSDKALGLLGRVDVIRGTVDFLDNRFELQSGVVSFESESGVRALTDLSAKTRVQNVEIFLNIRTQKDQVMAFLSSQPAKDETNLIALLTLGVDQDELLSGGAGQGLGAAVLPSVLSTPVQYRLESGLKKAKLVDTFQLLPYYSTDTKSTGLKLVVGKELFPRFRLLYSTDLIGTGSENTVRAEQRVNDNFSVQGNLRNTQTQTETEFDLGVDFEFRTEF